jgi:hypothetical protein
MKNLLRTISLSFLLCYAQAQILAQSIIAGDAVEKANKQFYISVLVTLVPLSVLIYRLIQMKKKKDENDASK